MCMFYQMQHIHHAYQNLWLLLHHYIISLYKHYQSKNMIHLTLNNIVIKLILHNWLVSSYNLVNLPSKYKYSIKQHNWHELSLLLQCWHMLNPHMHFHCNNNLHLLMMICHIMFMFVHCKWLV